MLMLLSVTKLRLGYKNRLRSRQFSSLQIVPVLDLNHFILLMLREKLSSSSIAYDLDNSCLSKVRPSISSFSLYPSSLRVFKAYASLR